MARTGAHHADKHRRSDGEREGHRERDHQRSRDGHSNGHSRIRGERTFAGTLLCSSKRLIRRLHVSEVHTSTIAIGLGQGLNTSPCPLPVMVSCACTSSQKQESSVLQRRMGAGTGKSPRGATGMAMRTGTTIESMASGSGRACTQTAHRRRAPTSNTASTTAAQRRRPFRRTTGGQPRRLRCSLSVRCSLKALTVVLTLRQASSGGLLALRCAHDVSMVLQERAGSSHTEAARGGCCQEERGRGAEGRAEACAQGVQVRPQPPPPLWLFQSCGWLWVI